MATGRAASRMQRRLWILAFGGLSVASGLACSALAGINDYVIGDCKGGQCSGEGGLSDGSLPGDSGALPADDSGVPCLGRDPKAIRVGASGNTFCIDTTEVTVAQYDAFLAARIDPNSQPAICAWNTTFQPNFVIPDGGSPPPPNHPVGSVDWCDALAYCTWAGKYLCGRVENGKKVGPVTPEGAFDNTTHQWLLACTAEGKRRFPYGNVYDPSRCNFAEYDAEAPVDVGSPAGCVGGFDGVHDLLGNVWEWYDDTCQPAQFEVDGGDGGPARDGCGVRGGGYSSPGTSVDCSKEAVVPRDTTGPHIGFRCCSD
jgi:formylglycine-generating enzyme required for sulfatase activity